MKPEPLKQAVTLVLASKADWRAILASTQTYIELLVAGIAEAIATKIKPCPDHWLGCTSLMDRDLCMPDEHPFRSLVRYALDSDPW